jgi:hypothetical protein
MIRKPAVSPSCSRKSPLACAACSLLQVFTTFW